MSKEKKLNTTTTTTNGDDRSNMRKMQTQMDNKQQTTTSNLPKLPNKNTQEANTVNPQISTALSIIGTTFFALALFLLHSSPLDTTSEIAIGLLALSNIIITAAMVAKNNPHARLKQENNE